MIGFACKVVPDDIFINPSEYHTKSTTVTAIKNLSPSMLSDKLDLIIEHNLRAIAKLVSTVGTLHPDLRMVRLPSDILPLYTHESTKDYYNNSALQVYVERSLSKIGETARQSGTRLSFHPAQMILISSINNDTNKRSIVELEYHARMVEMMGFGKSFQDFKCNIHVNGGGPEIFRSNWPALSSTLQNIITIENDEYTSSLSDCLTLSDLCPTVFDIHHEWLKTGSVVTRCNAIIDNVIASWKGVRPTMHVSTSRARLLNVDNVNIDSFSVKDLRSHSSIMWDAKLNNIIADYYNDFDIMVEAKHKNVAAKGLYDFIQERDNVVAD